MWGKHHSPTITKMDIIPTVCCVLKKFKLKCSDCKRIYNLNNVKKHRERKNEKIIKTRSVISKKRSLYHDILCIDCNSKGFKDYCHDCVIKYNAERWKKRSIKKPKLSNEINLDQVQQTNQINSNKQIINGNKIVSISNKCVDSYSKNNRSKYADLFCRACQNKMTTDLCYDCKKKYVCARSKKAYHAKKNKSNSKALAIPINLADQSEPNCGNVDSFSRNESDTSDQDTSIIEQTPSTGDPNVQPSRERSDKTYQNNWSFCPYSPNSKNKMIKVNYNSMPEKNKKDLREFFSEKINDNNTVEVCKIVANKYKDNNKTKSKDDYYKLASAMSPVLENKTKSEIRNIFGCRNEKAGQIKEGKATRKPRDLKITEENKSLIRDFFYRSDISRINPCKKSIRLGMFLSYMRMPYRKALKQFKEEHPTVQVSLRTFWNNRPNHIRPIAMTPLNACQCVFCANINLKLKILKLKDIANEQELYKILICKKTGRFRSYNCIKGKCKKCRDWKTTIENHACHLDMTKEIYYHSWQYVDYYQKKTGKKVSKRMLVKRKGTLRDCLDELINIDVLRPGKSKEYTFVKHFFTQSVQFQMYLDCKASLKSGQCLGIQDFAQNIEIKYLREIKASNWAKTQVTVHPQVFYYRNSQSDKLERQVIVHLTDITKHDPHIVHHMTQDY